MANFNDAVQIKDRISQGILRKGIKNNVVASMPSLRMSGTLEQADANVHAIGVGYKITEGEVTRTLAIRFYVVQKIAKSKLPKKAVLPGEVDGVPTDVIESRPAFFMARGPRAVASTAHVAPLASAPVDCSRDKQKIQRPIRAGISIAHHAVSAGTLAYFCRSRKKGDDPNKIYALSNNHVFANVNQAKTGDDIYQPGPADGGVTGDAVATLSRFKKLSLSGKPNTIDAAIAQLADGIQWNQEICTIGAVTGTERGTEGMRVRKHGRTTGYTEGLITDESYDALVGMDHNNPDIVARFTNQLRIDTLAPYRAFGLGGDSGSLVLRQDGRHAVGLYFAGPDSGDYGIANQIEDVLSGLEIELVT